MKILPTQLDVETPYWEGLVAKRRYPHYASKIEKDAILKAHALIATPTTALEIGCEGGRWSKLLSDLGWKLICTDIVQESLVFCKKKIPTAECILVNPDDTKIPAATESIGLLLCIEVPPVIHADWFMCETFRVLQKGGLVVGVLWNLWSWRGLFAHLKGNGYWYQYSLSYRAWRNRLRKEGFTLLHTEGYCWPPFQRTSNSPLVPATAQIERYLGLRKLVSLSPLIVFIAQKD